MRIESITLRRDARGLPSHVDLKILRQLSHVVNPPKDNCRILGVSGERSRWPIPPDRPDGAVPLAVRLSSPRRRMVRTRSAWPARAVAGSFVCGVAREIRRRAFRARSRLFAQLLRKSSVDSGSRGAG